MPSIKTTRQFGLWDSPISPVSLSRGMNFSNVILADDGTLVWLESRSDRNVLVVQPPDGQAARDLNDEFNIRAKVGYGGGDFTIGDGYVFFVDGDSGRIFRQPLQSGKAEAVTPVFGSSASPALSPDGRWLLFVHSYEGQEALAVVDAEGKSWPQRLVTGDDFYMQPTWNPDGKRIAWIAWNHPNMPWDGTFLRMADLHTGDDFLPIIGENVTIAGDDGISIFQPEFSPDGRYLAYVSDASGWWQLCLYDLGSGEHRQVTDIPAEHGQPAWVQGMRTYGFAPDGNHLFFLRNQDASVSIWRYVLDTDEQEQLHIEDAYTYLNQISVSAYEIALIASGSTTPTRVITCLPRTEGTASIKLRVWRRATSEELPREAYTLSQAVSWQGLGGENVHGIYYPTHNKDFEGSGVPPLIVRIHGGPTSQRFLQFDQSSQFFATRGYAVLDVNYRGSTGYGREFRNLLRGSWGVCDVQDALSGAQHLVDQELVDDSKIVIMGGSAGGFTVLKAMQDHPGFFKAGINLFGVTNQFTLAADTHKFEAHYADTLLGPLPEAAALFRERSPIFYVDKIQDPIAVFQGEDDVVVPRAQSDELVESLRRRGIPHIYHLYPGEGHGFRKEETIAHMYTEIDKFLREYVIYT
ncbi:MAG: S9 family peptidase [Chloroflexota bacterium]|nr:S9 family peptidase [Chloroflexota bacterium]